MSASTTTLEVPTDTVDNTHDIAGTVSTSTVVERQLCTTVGQQLQYQGSYCTYAVNLDVPPLSVPVNLAPGGTGAAGHTRLYYKLVVVPLGRLVGSACTVV